MTRVQEDSDEQVDKIVSLIIPEDKIEECISISQWLVEKGAQVNNGQDLVKIKTEYSEFVLKSPIDGVITSILLDTFDQISMDTPLVGIISLEKIVAKKNQN